MDQQVRATRQLDQLRIDLLAMFNIRANDQHFAISLIRKPYAPPGWLCF